MIWKEVKIRVKAATAATILLALALFAGPTLGLAQTGSPATPAALEVFQKTGVSQGLCVSLNAHDGAWLAGFQNNGRMLVHALSLSDAEADKTRESLLAAKVYGLVSVERVNSLSRLPYADHTANLLIADLDALGSKAPPKNEIMRVVAPGGAAWLKQGGGWSSTSKAMPSEFDEWTHWNHNPENNPVSRDKTVKPPTGIKWMGWYIKRENNSEGLNGPPGWYAAIAGGRIYHQVHTMIGGKTNRRNFLEARDAWNGTLSWIRQGARRNDAPRVLADGQRVYTALSITNKGAGTLLEIDPATGETRHTFQNLPSGSGWHAIQPIRAGDLLIATVAESLFVIDAATRAIRWTFTGEAGSRLILPSASSKDDRLFVAATPPQAIFTGRFPHVRVAKVHAFELRSGKALWTSTDFVGKGGGTNAYPLTAQVTYTGNEVALFSDGNYGDPGLQVLDAKDGKMLWLSDYQVWKRDADPRDGPKDSYWKVSPGKYFGQGLVHRDGKLWVLTKTKVASFHPRSGAVGDVFEAGIPNNRCSRAYATENYFLLGFTSYVAKDLSFHYSNVTRSTCGSGGYPAYGQVFYGPNGQCGCANWLRTTTSLHSQNLPDAAPDSERLEKGPAAAPKSGPSAQGNPVTHRTGSFPSREVVTGPHPIVADWNNNDILPDHRTAVVSAGDMQFSAVTNEHRLEARKGSDVAWTFTAGGRILGVPVLVNGMVLFGSHDGYVYALRSDDGKLVWRFLAARSRAKMVAFSQVESVGPVFGVVLLDGKVAVTAGRHPEMDGGIWAWGLEPTTGTVAWKGVIHVQRPFFPNNSQEIRGYKNHILNDAPTLESGVIKLPGTTIDSKNPPNGQSTMVFRPLEGKQSAIRGAMPTVVQRGADLMLRNGRKGDAIEITEINGTVLLSQSLYGEGETIVACSHLSPGRYVLRIRRGDSQQVFGASIWLRPDRH